MKRYFYVLCAFIAVLLFSLEMIGSGINSQGGLIFRGVNAKDGIWNLALIAELTHHFPPEHPGFAGLPLRGYHFLYHLAIAVFSKLTFLPILFLYFQLFPLLVSFLWGWGVYKTIVLLEKDKRSAYISMLVTFFGGSFAFILPLIGHKELSIDSALGIAQPYGSSLPNPAFASSIAVLIWSFYSLIQLVKTGKMRWGILLAFLCGVSIGFKVYAGMILLGALFISAAARIFFNRKYDLLLCFLGALVLSLIIFLPFNAQYGFLTYAPFWPLFRLVEGPLNFTNWDELWHIYNESGNTVGIIKLSLVTAAIFIVGNLGTRLLCIVSFFQKRALWREPSSIFFISMLAISTVIPFMFLQPSGGGFNIIQMFWYALFLMGLYTGPGIVAVGRYIRVPALKIAFYFLVIALTAPSSITVLHGIIRSKTIIPPEKLELYSFLSSYKSYDDTVLEIPSLPEFTKDSLEHWFWNNSSVIIAALGNKRLYLANEVVSFPYDERFDRYKLIVKFSAVKRECASSEEDSACPEALASFIDSARAENIRILYLPDGINLPVIPGVQVLNQHKTGGLYEVLPL